MDKNCTIGLVQMESLSGETQNNLQKVIIQAENAAQLGVDILCFPEMSLHGYSPVDAKYLAEPLSGDNVRTIVSCSVRLGITLLVGMAEKSFDPEKPYLTHLVALADGQVGAYRKTHLGRNEEKYFTPGKEFPIFKSHGLCFGVGLCWDWHFPEVATIYSLKGGEVLFAPHASPRVIGDRKELWMRYLGARAYDNSVYLAACNVLGRNGKGQEFQGKNLILGPKGEIIKESLEEQEGITFSKLSAAYLNGLRQRNAKTMKEIFFLAERKKDLYRELIELEIPE